MQHEITRPQRLLDDTGNIAEPGFAKKLYWQYSRADIKAPAMRIKGMGLLLYRHSGLRHLPHRFGRGLCKLRFGFDFALR